MTQRFVHHVAQVLAPGGAPLFVTDGFREYATALLTHYGQWVQPPRRQAQGPAPKPRWMPLPHLLYAHVVKTVRRRGLVNVTHHGVFLAPAKPSTTSWRHPAGTSTPPLWSGSTAASGSMSPRAGDGSARCARAKTDCGSSSLCITCIPTAVCRTSAYARRCRIPRRPMAGAPPRRGGRVRQRWRQGCLSEGGASEKFCFTVYRRGPSRKRCKRRAEQDDGGMRGAECVHAQAKRVQAGPATLV
jgi:hypothetical protein